MLILIYWQVLGAKHIATRLNIYLGLQRYFAQILFVTTVIKSNISCSEVYKKIMGFTNSPDNRKWYFLTCFTLHVHENSLQIWVSHHEILEKKTSFSAADGEHEWKIEITRAPPGYNDWLRILPITRQ